MKHKLIVFDWNGTLLSDTLPSLVAGNVCLEFYGAKPLTLAQYRATFTFPILHFYKLNGLSVDEILARKDEANTVFQAAYEDLAKNARTRKGARELLGWLTKSCGFTCIILSNYRTARIRTHLERLGIAHYFTDVLAFGCNGASIVETTHKTERLQTYMREQGFKPEDTVIIGDSTEEPDIARVLGLTSIGITDGYISRARLMEAAPDHIINHLGEIRPYLTDKWSLPRG
jgi:phosphoglycolate phosphatase-like HAD superfamily hydrolase